MRLGPPAAALLLLAGALLGCAADEAADEPAGSGFVPAGSTTVADLVQALVALKTNTRDVIAILQAIKAAGALHADLIVQ